MPVIEIVSLVCLFILFLIMFFVVKNCLVLMHLWRQRAERDGAVMDVQDRENPTLDTPPQPRVVEMAPMGMHLIPRQKGVQESGGNYIDTAIGIHRMLWSQVHFFHQRIVRRPLPRQKGVQESGGNYIDTAIGIHRMLWSQVHFFPSKNCKAPTSSRKR